VTAPAGWSLAGNPKGLTLREPGGGAAMTVTVAEEASAGDAEHRFFADKSVTRGQWDGEAAGDVRWNRFTAKRKGGDLAGTVGYAERDGRVFELLAVAPAPQWEAERQELEGALASFEELGGDARIDADRLELVPVAESLALSSFAERWPSTVGLSELALLNRVKADGSLPADSLAKRVVAGELARRNP
jgi:hypothetical protein